MTFYECMESSGYKVMTSFWEDFTVADRFGRGAVKDTYKRVFEEWKGNYKWLTELALVLNHKLWEHHGKGETEIMRVYDRLCSKVEQYALENLKGEELDYYIRTTD